MSGDAVALSRCFAAAKAQLMMTQENEVDAVAVMENMMAILKSAGVQRFSEALRREDSRTRRAVCVFLVEDNVRHNFPKTWEVYCSVNWP